MPAEPTELQRWDCYVDEIDGTHVHLVMADVTAGGDDREIGSFPRHLLEHLAPRLGQYVTVRIMSDERMLIENTVVSEEARGRSEAKIEELLALLRRLRDEDDQTDITPAGV